MSSSDLLSARHRRAPLGGSGRLKTNKVTVSNERPRLAKLRKDGDTDIAVESAEFQLLVRLYVPAKLLIKNNKVLKKQLFNYLPIIVNESLPELNFKLHIFLSTIVTTYILSWYLTKLNTDNFEFLESVYGILCDFVKDFARRILRIVELDDLLGMVDEWADILDTHIRLVQLENGVPRMVSEYLKRNQSQLLSEDELSQANIIDRVLQESHIIFKVPRNTRENEARLPSSTNEEETLPHLSSFEETPDQSDPLLDYLRVVTRNILITTFQAEDTTLVGQGPTSSAIAMRLVTTILADLVLEKVVTKLLSPQFIMGGLIGRLASDMNNKQTSKEPQEWIPVHKKVFSAVQKAYFTLNSVALSFKSHKPEGVHTRPIILSPVFSLADAITNISGRKPLATYLVKIGRSVIFSSTLVCQKFDSVARTYLAAKIRLSPVLKDAFLGSVVQKLIDIVFSKSNEVSEKDDIENLEDLTTAVFTLLNSDSVPLSPMWFAYKGETEEDMKLAVQEFLQIFDLKNGNAKSPFSESSKVNQLLIIRLLDSLVQYVYPELLTLVPAGSYS